MDVWGGSWGVSWNSHWRESQVVTAQLPGGSSKRKRRKPRKWSEVYGETYEVPKPEIIIAEVPGPVSVPEIEVPRHALEMALRDKLREKSEDDDDLLIVSILLH